MPLRNRIHHCPPIGVRLRWCTAILLMVLLACAPARAAPSPSVAAGSSDLSAGLARMVRFEHLTMEDGLVSNTVNDLAQDGYGFLWIATSDGLGRFDGHELRTWTHSRHDPGSLPANDVRALEVDGAGRLWVGTRGGGLARYESDLDTFTVWRADPDDPATLPADYVSALASDPQGNLWIGTRTAGLARLDASTGTFTRFPPEQGSPGALRGSGVESLLVGRDGTLWVGGRGHGLYRLDPGGVAFDRYVPDDGPPNALPSDRIRAIHEDSAGRLWIATPNGLALREGPGDGFRVFRAATPGGPGLANENVADVAEAADGRLWLSSLEGGLQLFDPGTGTTEFVARHQPTRRHSLADDTTTALLVDRTGILWVGTHLGLDRHDPETLAFESYQADPTGGSDFPDDNVWGIQQTRDGALWIATNGSGVVRFDPSTSRVTSWRHDPEDPASLASDRIFCLLVDSADRLWAGTADAGLDRFDPETGAWIHHRHDPEDADSIYRDTVYALREARDGDLWVALLHGFDRLDPETGVFAHPAFIEDDPDGGMLATTFDLVEDDDGLLWIGTFLNGLYTLEPESRTWTKLRPDPDEPQSLPTSKIHALLVDRAGTVWAGTDMGVFRHLGDGSVNRWQPWGVEEGLANVAIVSLHEDPVGHLWFGTSRGLHRLDPASGDVRVWFASDGLPSSELAWHALTGLADGRLGVGTAQGFALLDTSGLDTAPPPPPVVLTGMELFNEPVPLRHRVPPATGDDGVFTLERTLTTTRAVTLSHRETVVSFAFAALDYRRPERIRTAYRLEGLDPQWLPAEDGRRVATYTNLPAGQYSFQVRAAHPGGEWGSTGAGLAVTVLPPPWRSPWATTLYALALAGLAAGVVMTLHRRAEVQRERAEKEAALNRRLRRLDALKDEFLANTSHELRTPLHGIIGIAESLIDGATGRLSEATRGNLSLVVASGRRLASLVDDLLDVSKLKHRNLSLRQRPLDLRSLADVVLTLQRPLADDRKLELRNAIPPDLPLALGDEGRLQQVLHNLVGNAVKFTPAGRITVEGEVRDDGRLAVHVSDTGPGIAPEDRERIFTSFEQLDGDLTREAGGTGLGLTLARQLVELHGGALGVDDAPGGGARFTFTLAPAGGGAVAEQAAEKDATDERSGPAGRRRFDPPADDAPEPDEPAAIEGTVHSPEADVDGAGATSRTAAGPGFTVLVVDDEPVNRQVLVNQLALEHYRIVEAADGEQALEAFEAEHPDLVLLDVMMPRMSGYDVCRRLRERSGPSEMPVIYLSAKSRSGDLVTGFESGANDYLTKPVARAELVARVKTHLELLDVHRNLERRVAERTEDLRQANAELERLASLDGLTRIPNRRTFDATLERRWAEHRERGAPLAIVLCDVDDFKRYNDHYGHQRGDDALVAVAAALSGALRRAEDLAARYGGEEMVVLLPDTDAESAARLAGDLLAAVRALAIPHSASRAADHVTLSVGVAAVVPAAGSAPAELVERADRALYRAKERGRDRVEVADDPGSSPATSQASKGP